MALEEKEIIKEFAVQIKERLGSNLILLKMFGSKARGDFTKDSDVDILIVVKQKNIAVRDEIYDILFRLDPYYEYKISIILFSLYEYRKNEEIKSTFIKYINLEGIDL